MILSPTQKKLILAAGLISSLYFVPVAYFWFATISLCVAALTYAWYNNLLQIAAEYNPLVWLGIQAVPPTRFPDRVDELLPHHQEVNMIKNFIGTSEAAHNLRDFSQWYTQDVVLGLMRGQENPANAVRVLFTHMNFIEEFRQFKMMLANLKRPGIFISKEPGALGQNHFIMGVIQGNTLLLVNPIGMTTHHDFYDKIQAMLKDRICDEIILSNTQFQRDPSGLVSCGPLSVALCAFFSNSNLTTLFETVKSQATKQNETDAYKTVDLAPSLVDPLRTIVNCALERYQDSIVQLRRNHLEELLGQCQGHENAQASNDYFDDALNLEAQVLLNKLVLKDLNVIGMLEAPEFLALRAPVVPPVVENADNAIRVRV